MKWVDIEQNTDEWLDLRMGKLTGTGVKIIMATSNEYQVLSLGKDSFGIANTKLNKVMAKKYANKVEAVAALAVMKKGDLKKSFTEPSKKLAVSIAREQITGKRSLAESYSNADMMRGHEQEPIAATLYENENFVDATNGGFFNCGNLGCSPDRLIGDNGLIEIKSVIDHVQYATIKRGGIDPVYKWQVYFNLMITELDWIDYVSYCADFPEATQLYTYRVHRKDCAEYFSQMKSRIAEFFKLVEESKLIIRGQ